MGTCSRSIPWWGCHMGNKFEFGKTVYRYSAQDAINAELPELVKRAMELSGWNAFGVYELVKEELRKEKARIRKEQKP